MNRDLVSERLGPVVGPEIRQQKVDDHLAVFKSTQA
jgi:hypothetical protein